MAYQEAIDDREQKLNARDLAIRKKLLEIQAYVKGSSRMRCVDSPVELDDNWSEWTTTQGIIGKDDDDE